MKGFREFSKNIVSQLFKASNSITELFCFCRQLKAVVQPSQQSLNSRNSKQKEIEPACRNKYRLSASYVR